MIAHRVKEMQAMMNVKSNINSNARVFSSNLKRDKVKKYVYNYQQSCETEIPANIELLLEADKGRDSIMSIKSNDIEHKPIVADPTNGELH